MTLTTLHLWSISLKTYMLSIKLLRSLRNIYTVAPHLIYKVHTLVIVIFSLIIVMQTDLWERESLCVRERTNRRTFFLPETQPEFNRLSSLHPDLHHPLLTAWGRWWERLPQLGYYWLVPIFLGLKARRIHKTFCIWGPCTLNWLESCTQNQRWDCWEL